MPNVYISQERFVGVYFFIYSAHFIPVCLYISFVQLSLLLLLFFVLCVCVCLVLFFCCCIKYTLFLLPSYYSFIITLYYSVVSYYVPNRINLCQCSSTAVQNNKNNKNNYSPLNIELQQFIPSIIYMYCLFIVQQHIIGKDGRYREECIQNNAVSIYIT